jgi:hypothetical protein
VASHAKRQIANPRELLRKRPRLGSISDEKVELRQGDVVRLGLEFTNDASGRRLLIADRVRSMDQEPDQVGVFFDEGMWLGHGFWVSQRSFGHVY